MVVVVSRRGVIFLWTIVFLEFDFPRWDRRLGLLAEDGFTGFVGFSPKSGGGFLVQLEALEKAADRYPDW